MKTCPKCGRSLDESAFTRNRCTKDGLDSWCRKCHKEAELNRQHADPERKPRLLAALRTWAEEHPERCAELRKKRAQKVYLAGSKKRWWPE